VLAGDDEGGVGAACGSVRAKVAVSVPFGFTISMYRKTRNPTNKMHKKSAATKSPPLHWPGAHDWDVGA
jgi:hypothetical protein